LCSRCVSRRHRYCRTFHFSAREQPQLSPAPTIFWPFLVEDDLLRLSVRRATMDQR
jgi:hypothetical protein